MPNKTGEKRNLFNRRTFNGIRIVVAAFGILCGLTGIIAGSFEILQGNVSTGGFVISTIDSGYSMADDFTYFAVTIIPNFLVTGILAIIASLLVMAWSAKFVHRKKGVLVLAGLVILQTLVGGGWQPCCRRMPPFLPAVRFPGYSWFNNISSLCYIL